MRTYNITFETEGQVISQGQTQANSLKKAKNIAQFWKRRIPEVNKYSPKKVKTTVTKSL